MGPAAQRGCRESGRNWQWCLFLARIRFQSAGDPRSAIAAPSYLPQWAVPAHLYDLSQQAFAQQRTEWLGFEQSWLCPLFCLVVVAHFAVVNRGLRLFFGDLAIVYGAVHQPVVAQLPSGWRLRTPDRPENRPKLAICCLPDECARPQS